jgi:hypothetical protein
LFQKTEESQMYRTMWTLLTELRRRARRIVLLTLPPIPKIQFRADYWERIEGFNMFIKSLEGVYCILCSSHMFEQNSVTDVNQDYWVFDFVHFLVFQKHTRPQHFGNWIRFHPWARGGRLLFCWVCLERANLNLWTLCSFVFLEYRTMDRVQKPSNPGVNQFRIFYSILQTVCTVNKLCLCKL